MLETQPVASVPAETREPRVFDLRYLPWGSLLIMALLVFIALGAPLLTSYSPIEQALPDKLLPPAWDEGGRAEHLLGTDMFGRDMWHACVTAQRSLLVIALSCLRVAGGTAHRLRPLHWWPGRYRIMRIVDAALAFPTVLFALLLAVTMGQGLRTLMIAIGLLLWARFARVMRGEVLAVRTRDFVALARVRGCSHWRIMLVHILPNVMNTFMVLLTLHVGVVVLAEASLSFLCAGIPPPTPSWGQMVAEGRGKIASAWWLSLLPGLAITLVVLAFNLFGDWLRDRLDPKLRQLMAQPQG